MLSRLPALILTASTAACAVTSAVPAPLDVPPGQLDAYWVATNPYGPVPKSQPEYSCATATIVISSSGRVSNVALERVSPDTPAARAAALHYFLSFSYTPSQQNESRHPIRVPAAVLSILVNEDGSPIDLDLVRAQCSI
jgi:hypothetical protein